MCSRTLFHMSKQHVVLRQVLLAEGYLINPCSHSQILAVHSSDISNSQIDATISYMGPYVKPSDWYFHLDMITSNATHLELKSS